MIIFLATSTACSSDIVQSGSSSSDTRCASATSMSSVLASAPTASMTWSMRSRRSLASLSFSSTPHTT